MQNTGHVSRLHYVPWGVDVKEEAPLYIQLTGQTRGDLQPEIDALSGKERRRIIAHLPEERERSMAMRASLNRALERPDDDGEMYTTGDSVAQVLERSNMTDIA